MAAAGPAMSMLLAGAVLSSGFVVARERRVGLVGWAPLRYLATINLFVGVFNLLPGFPLDGGRVLRSILWALTGDILKATHWAARSGQFIGWSMVALAVRDARLHGRADFIWFGLIGWFIAWLAGASYRQQQVRSRLDGVTVGQIMTPHPAVRVRARSPLEELAHEHFLGGEHSRYPVLLRGRRSSGVVSLADIKAIARADWPYVQVIDVTEPRPVALERARRDAGAAGAAAARRPTSPGRILVVGEGRLVGIVTRADVMSRSAGTVGCRSPNRAAYVLVRAL